MKKFIVMVITIFFSSCGRKVNYNNLIVYSDSAYWDYYDNQTKIPIGSYLFKKNGECIRYFYTKYDSFFRYNDEDVVRPNTWVILGDSILKIRGLDRRIISITSDSMELLNPKLNDTLIFRRKKLKP